MLKLRVITGLLLLAGILVALFLLNLKQFAIAMGLVVALGAWEWSRFMGIQNRLYRGLYLVLVAALMYLIHANKPGLYAALDSDYDSHLTLLLLIALIWWCLAVALIVRYPTSGRLWQRRYWLSALMGLVTLIPAWVALIGIRGVHYELEPLLGATFLLYMMAIIWAADIGAYFAGKAFGKTKLAPKASPGKTWEGVVGGILASMLLAYSGIFYFDFLQDKKLAILLTVLVIFTFSIIGDLAESIFKREQQLKDSGRCLPGHGGILDRIDSLTAATPVFALCILFLGLGP